MKHVLILVLAAGASSRMRGGDKLLEQVEGETLLRRQVRVALETGARVVVTLSDKRPNRIEALSGLDVETVSVFDAELGMSASVRAGIAAVGSETLVMILPADMPEIDTLDLITVLSAARGGVVRGATADGVPGHPVVFPKRLFAAMAQVEGDQGARDVLRGEKVGLVPLPGDHAITDLDTPEDWAAWREQNT